MDAQLHLKPTRSIPNPHYYILAMADEYRGWALDEVEAPRFKGCWREKVFNTSPSKKLQLELGTGNGFFFAHYAGAHPDELLLGIEKKFKPLIQSIRRALHAGCGNARILRYDAGEPAALFAEGEINDVFIHFPDPWPKKRWFKNRLIQDDFLSQLYQLQAVGSRVEFKTDSEDYYDWAMERFKRSPYRLSGSTRHLHQSEFAPNNFVTHFERIFLKQKLPIFYALLERH